MLVCPKCLADSRVLRSFDDDRTVVRLRECKRCSHHFMTTEMINKDVMAIMEILAKLHKDEMQE